MRECDNSKVHISSNFILSICLLIAFITLQHLATLNHTIPNYTYRHFTSSHLHFTTLPFCLTHLHFLSICFTYCFVFSLYRSNGFVMELLAFPEWHFLTPHQGLYFMFPRANFFPLS